MSYRLGAWLLFGVVALSCSAARAQYGYDYCYADRFERLPFYALHPPVYYSLPIPRTYGYSPFAYPPGVMTPEISIEASAPETMINPHVQPQAKPTASKDRVAAAPLRIRNPFVAQAPEIALARRPEYAIAPSPASPQPPLPVRVD